MGGAEGASRSPNPFGPDEVYTSGRQFRAQGVTEDATTLLAAIRGFVTREISSHGATIAGDEAVPAGFRVDYEVDDAEGAVTVTVARAADGSTVVGIRQLERR